MTRNVYVHVGPHKTGTTYVQSLLTRNAVRLAEQGVLFPRGTWAAQARSVSSVMGRKVMPATGLSTVGEWDALVSEVRSFDGPGAVISNEMISTASREKIRRLVKGLRRLDVHVVLTARDLSRVLPAMWQTGLRSRATYSWDEYVAGVRTPAAHGRWGRSFWQGHDVPEVLARWRRYVPHERLHVVTVPPPGNPPDLLWQRFCTVLDVDPSGHDLTANRSNPSLGTAEAELLRRVNTALGESGMRPQPWLHAVRHLALQLEGRPQAHRFGLPEQDREWVAARSQAMVDRLRSEGYHVVGDLDELLPAGPPEGVHPGDTSEADTLDAAVAAITALIRQLKNQETPEEEEASGRARSAR